MRVSGIETFLGGADNVVALEILQGEQRILTGILKDGSGDALDITNYTFEIENEFYLANVTTSARSTSITALAPTTPGQSGTVTVAKGTEPTTGEFVITIPENLYGDSITSDITTDVPVCVAYARYSDGTPGDTGVNSRVSRFVIIIRRSTFTD